MSLSHQIAGSFSALVHPPLWSLFKDAIMLTANLLNSFRYLAVQKNESKIFTSDLFRGLNLGSFL